VLDITPGVTKKPTSKDVGFLFISPKINPPDKSITPAHLLFFTSQPLKHTPPHKQPRNP
jgi:hypothetical protein